MGASIAAIVLLGFVLLHEWRDKKKITEPLGEEPPQTKKQVALPSQLPPRYPAKTDQLYPSQQTELRRPVGPQGGLEPDILLSPTSEALSPLFEDDPLFAIPHPANIHLFMQIRNNDIMVNGEDACAISPDETRLALCDGVSVSNFSRPWAMLLAQQWVTHPLTEYDAEALEAWLDEPRKRWQEWVLTTWLPAINKRNPSLGYKTFSRQEAEERIEEGAASTFLGISLDKVATTWSAVAFGDTCLFHFSPNNANNWSVKYFPMHTAADFSDRPASISSSLRVNPFALTMHLKHQEGTYKAGDTLLMATDAFAMWLFKQLEQRTLEAAKLLQLTSKENFAILVDQERAKKQMNNDDTTLLIVPL